MANIPVLYSGYMGSNPITSTVFLEKGMIMSESKIFLALDGNTPLPHAHELLYRLEDEIAGIKVSPSFILQNFLVVDNLLELLDEYDVKMFFDFKFHDIPFQVKETVSSVRKTFLPDYISIHLAGGKQMIEMAHKAVQDTNSNLVGIAILSSLNTNDLSYIGFQETWNFHMERFLDIAYKSPMDAMVCAPKDLVFVKACLQKFNDMSEKNNLPSKTMTLFVPGCRPSWYNGTDDHKRSDTPEYAVLHGADYVIIGRPITETSDSLGVVQRINDDIASVVR